METINLILAICGLLFKIGAYMYSIYWAWVLIDKPIHMRDIQTDTFLQLMVIAFVLGKAIFGG